MKMLNKIIPLCSAAVMLSGCGDAQSGRQIKPNIIFILADDMGYSDMSFQGSPIQTPNLDRLRENGMFLSRNYAQPQCSPSRVAFLSGRYPYHWGLHEHIILPYSNTGIPGEVKTIAEKMQEAGYRTAVVGKWHVGGRLQSYLPHNQGFDYSFAGINGAMSYWNYSHYDYSDIIQNGEKYYPSSMIDNEDSGNTYVTELWKQKAIEVFENHDLQQPLFMYLSFTAPHHPLQAPQEILEKYSAFEVEEYWAGPNAEKNRKAHHRISYMAMVDAMDSAIGYIIEALETNGMLENTLIVLSSDNGGIPEGDNRPLRSVKGDSFEGGIRVPGIAFWPGKIKPGSESSELVYIADWYPTFAEIAGLSCEEENLDGVSALPVLLGRKGPREGLPVISSGRHAYITSDYALVGGGEDYQLLVEKKLSNFQLFDLQADISQDNPALNRPDVFDNMVQAFLPHFKKINRGFFNWDIRYSRYRLNKRPGDHNYDFVINDVPVLCVDKKQGKDVITISPVSKEMVYRLRGRTDGGKKWHDIDEYVCRTDADHYVFPAVAAMDTIQEYHIDASFHNGIPAREFFSIDDKYKSGLFISEDNLITAEHLLPEVDGFLPIVDIKGGRGISIVKENLYYPGWPSEGGALQLKKPGAQPEAFMTRYFVEPFSSGKVFASMLIQYSGCTDCAGEINWLRQNGTRTTQMVSLPFETDGIFLDHTDTVSRYPKTHIADYGNEVVCVVFEFDLGTTGNDNLHVYINPDLKNGIPEPDASIRGEFTFDRLQTKLLGRVACEMRIDEIHVGRTFEDVIYQGIEQTW